MRKMYYDVKISVKEGATKPLNSGQYEFVNNGFLIVELKKGKIEGIEGLLTRDYIYADVEDDGIILHYYELGFDNDYSSVGLDELFTCELELNEEIPLNFEIETETMLIRFETTIKVTDLQEQAKYDECLSDYKHSPVYTGEWQ